MAYPADGSSQEIQKSPFEFYGQHSEQLEKAWHQVQKLPANNDQQNFKRKDCLWSTKLKYVKGEGGKTTILNYE